ncbi:transglutaminase domain-containing protein [Thalassotalea crassostreae]|uniref:transglutaminase domain-containing protein n=1 Tax=Thalassotalea crassostreae TaxID=1763536 RepID=UPI000838963F|nr:transglutaminase domain-containing protein [Thalassotalea crassostreae]
MRYVVIFIVAIVIISSLDKPKRQSKFDQQMLEMAQNASDRLPRQQRLSEYQKGNVIFTIDSRHLSEQTIQDQINRFYPVQKYSNMFLWKDSGGNYATATANGLDFNHHFVNSYLVGIHPFKVENPWLPLYLLSKRKTYQFDKDQYGYEEMWQNSAQAFEFPRGDCEDHALALADWLISEGIDARVAIGDYKDSGHAWVVAKYNDEMYLLEATSKRVGKSWSHYPLASLSKHYKPTYMFNRTEFWQNTASSTTKDYLGSHWVKRSRFENKR